MATAEQVAKVFKAVCDPTRVKIIRCIGDGEKCACQLTECLDIAQSKLSYHMKILCESGIIECWYQGKWTHYRISKQGRDRAIELLTELTDIEFELDEKKSSGF